MHSVRVLSLTDQRTIFGDQSTQLGFGKFIHSIASRMLVVSDGFAPCSCYSVYACCGTTRGRSLVARAREREKEKEQANENKKNKNNKNQHKEKR